MQILNRRAFLATAGAASLVSLSPTISSAAVCITGGLPQFLPNRLTVDCATRINFANYRKNADYQGLAGVVTMTSTKGKYGTYPAGNLFLFPWLNAAGIKLGAAKDWQSVIPTPLTRTTQAGPIRGWTLPLDEYFCRVVLQAPIENFIGFRIDAPVAGANRDR